MGAAEAEAARKQAEAEKHRIERAGLSAGTVGFAILAGAVVIAATGGLAALGFGATMCAYTAGAAAAAGSVATAVAAGAGHHWLQKKAELDKAAAKESTARAAVEAKKEDHAKATRQSETAAAEHKKLQDELAMTELKKKLREEQANELHGLWQGADHKLQAAGEVASRYQLLFNDMKEVLGDLSLFTETMEAMQDQAQSFLEVPESRRKFNLFKATLKDLDTDAMMEQRQLASKLNKLNLSLFNKIVDATVSFNYGDKAKSLLAE